jgi:hypothetical protein
MVDNAFQAAANTIAVHVGFDVKSKSHAKPDMRAICDNGSGLIPEITGYAVRGSGTEREGDRTGLGRYGYCREKANDDGVEFSDDLEVFSPLVPNW